MPTHITQKVDTSGMGDVSSQGREGAPKKHLRDLKSVLPAVMISWVAGSFQVSSRFKTSSLFLGKIVQGS